MIKKGITRTVFLTKKYAIKVPRVSRKNLLWHLSRGILANESEREWSGYNDQLNPVIWSLGFVNVYKRAEPVTEKDLKEITFRTPSDFKPCNFGRVDGKVVWIDYDMNWNDCRVCSKGKYDAIQ